MVRVGVVGVGALGKHHARLYREAPGAELVGVYDVDPQQAAAIAEEFGAQAYADPLALAAGVDALSVAVPTDRHFAVVSELLGTGRHILVEKPLAASADEGARLLAQAQELGVALHVGHVERYNPVITYLEQRLRTPRFIEAHRLASYPPPRPGMRPRGTEVGVVLDLMIHDIDVILGLVNDEVEQVDAVGIPILSPTEDIANARLSFAGGCVANITASRVSPERMRKIRVFQPDAYLSLDYEAKQGVMQFLDGAQISREPVPIRDHNALQEELHDFVRVVQGALDGQGIAPAKNSAEHGQQALQVAERILASIAERQARLAE